MEKQDKNSSKVMPKSIFYLLAFVFFTYTFYLVLDLILPDGVVDNFIMGLPLWMKTIFFIILFVYLIFEVLIFFVYPLSDKKDK